MTTFRWARTDLLCGLTAAIFLSTFSSRVLAQGSGFVASVTPSTSNASAGTEPISSKKDKNKAKGPQEMPHFDAKVHDGILTVDGMVAKVGLNYDVDAPFLYFFVPGVGTAVVANGKFTNSTLEKNAIKGSTLTVTVDGHEIQLTNDGTLLKHPEKDVYVALNPSYASADRMPMMGFGHAANAPYVWPGAKSGPTQTTASAPPIPQDLRPKMATVSSYSVTVKPVDSPSNK